MPVSISRPAAGQICPRQFCAFSARYGQGFYDHNGLRVFLYTLTLSGADLRATLGQFRRIRSKNLPFPADRKERDGVTVDLLSAIGWKPVIFSGLSRPCVVLARPDCFARVRIWSGCVRCSWCRSRGLGAFYRPVASSARRCSWSRSRVTMICSSWFRLLSAPW